jgi:hypothetical protein
LCFGCIASIELEKSRFFGKASRQLNTGCLAGFQANQVYKIGLLTENVNFFRVTISLNATVKYATHLKAA